MYLIKVGSITIGRYKPESHTYDHPLRFWLSCHLNYICGIEKCVYVIE